MNRRITEILVCMLLIVSGLSSSIVITASNVPINILGGSDYYEDSFTVASNWICNGDVSIVQDPGNLVLANGLYVSGAASHNGFIIAPSQIYKVKVECTGFHNGDSPHTMVLITADGGTNSNVVVDITSIGNYDETEIWNVPENKRGTELGILISMSADLCVVTGMEWIKVTYWYNNPPNTPSNEEPEDGKTGVNIYTELSWDGGDPDGDTVYYDVYFEKNDNTPDELISEDQTDTTCNPGSLSYSTDYYWQIIAEDEDGFETEGPVWHFTTKDDPEKPPVISDIKTFYADGSSASDGEGLILGSMNLTNTYTAVVSDANSVKFDFGLQSHTDNDGSDGWTATFNSKYILSPDEKLTVTAFNSVGSDTETITPRIIPVLGWLVDFIGYVANHNSTDFASFSIETKEPVEDYNNFWELKAEVDFSTGSPENPDESPVDAEVPGGVPVDDVGGKYSYSGGIGSSIAISSDGVITVTGGFSAGVEAKSIGGEIGATLYGSIIIEDNTIKWEEMYIIIHGEVTIPVFLIPLKICGIGVEAGVDITPHVDIKFDLEPTTDKNKGIVPNLGIKISEGSGVECSVGAMVRAYLGVGFVIGDFYVEAGGDGTLTFVIPSDPLESYFGSFNLDAWIKGKIRFLFWTAHGKWTYSWSCKKNGLEGTDYTEEDWDTLDREYKDQGDYGEFVWETGDSGDIIKNAFPHACPNSAAFPGTVGKKQMLVWSHDNENKDAVEGMELYYTIWDDGEMDTPVTIPSTNDNQCQMDPQVVFDKNGNAICVFTQTDSNITGSSTIGQAMDASEIAYCIWDGQSWGEIQTITNNDHMDTSPVLGSNSNGDVIAVWSSDSDKDHETINDRNIYASFWDGSSWGEIITVAEGKIIATTPQVAIKDSNTATCVLTTDIDEDPETTDDQEAAYITISNTINGAGDITTVTSDGLQDISPTVVYGSDGNPYIVYLKNKFHIENGQKIYDGTIYYSNLNGGKSSSHHEILTGSFSDPVAFSTIAGSKKNGGSENVNFAVGFETKRGSKLGCALIKTNGQIETGLISSSESKYSEIDWCMASGSITTIAVERPTINSGNKCNLTFIRSHGLDKTAPVTNCDIDGTIINYGENGPIYQGGVEITLDVDDQGGSGLETTYYRVFDDGGWLEYTSPFTLSNLGDYQFSYYSVDVAGNEEQIKTKYFTLANNRRPDKPIRPDGPTSGSVNVKYTYGSVTTDPDGDQVYYWFDWGDETNSGWVGPYDSGKFGTAEHSWSEEETYNIKVKAKDENNAESEWSDPLAVTMPRNRVNRFASLNMLLNKLRNYFPLLFNVISKLKIFNKYLNSQMGYNNEPVVDLTIDPNSIKLFSEAILFFINNRIEFTIKNLGNVYAECDVEIKITRYDNPPERFDFWGNAGRVKGNSYDTLLKFLFKTSYYGILEAKEKFKGIKKITLIVDPLGKTGDVNPNNNVASIDVSYDDIFLPLSRNQDIESNFRKVLSLNHLSNRSI